MARPKTETKEQKEETVLPDVALGMRKNGDVYELVTVKYNALTKEAVVDTVESLGNNHMRAFNEFKVRVFKHGF